MVELSFHLDPIRMRVILENRQIEVKDAPYFDWLHCRLVAEMPGFATDFKWSVMSLELTSLADSLEELHQRFPVPGTAKLDPLEPNLTLDFELLANGTVNGRFSMTRDTLADITLKGGFEVDQSYLPGYATALRAFVGDSHREA